MKNNPEILRDNFLFKKKELLERQSKYASAIGGGCSESQRIMYTKMYAELELEISEVSKKLTTITNIINRRNK